MRSGQFLQLPGPTNIPRPVLEAFGRPACDFADPRFVAQTDSVFERTAEMFGAEAAFAYPSVGHGMWEAGLCNLLAPGATLGWVPTGRFSAIWHDVATEIGFPGVAASTSPRRGPSTESVAALVDGDPDQRIQALCVTHTETSNGVRTDIDAMRRALDAANHPALLVVDGVASMGTETLHLADQGIDLVLGASQKGLMMPPGLGLLLAGPKALSTNPEARPSPYWDWSARLNPEHTYQRFGGTPLMQHVFAWEAALDLIDEEGGMAAVVARHHRLSRAVHAAVETWGERFQIVATEPSERANAVTAVVAEGLQTTDITRTARDLYGVGVGGWLLADIGPGFRIGHLGALDEPTIMGALAGIEMTFRSLGVAHHSGLEAAMSVLEKSP